MGALKKYWWVGLIIVGLAVIGLQKCSINKLKDVNQLQSVTLSTLNDSVAVYISKAGKLTYKLISVEIEKDNLKKSLDIAGFDIKDLKDRNIKWRDITIALAAKLEAANEGTITLHDTTIVTKTDTVTGLAGSWSDDYLYLRPYIVKKEMKFNYTYSTGIKLLVAPNGKESVVSVYLTNPNDKEIANPYAKITTANSITIVPQKTWWGWKYIGFGAGVGLGYILFK